MPVPATIRQFHDNSSLPCCLGGFFLSLLLLWVLFLLWGFLCLGVGVFLLLLCFHIVFPPSLSKMCPDLPRLVEQLMHQHLCA